MFYGKIMQIGGLLVFVLFLVSFLFGFEPQITAHNRGVVPPMSFQDYMSGSIEQSGDTFFVRTLTSVAYPGAIAGVWVRNQLLSNNS